MAGGPGRSPAPPGAQPQGAAGQPLPASLPPSLSPSPPAPTGSGGADSMPVSLRVRLSLRLGPLLRAGSGAADRYRGAAAAPAVNLAAGWTGAGSGRGPPSREPLIQFGFFSYFPLLSPALSLLCQLSEMLCLTGSLSQISYHLKPLGRER